MSLALVAALVLGRPWALALFVVPLALLLLARRTPRARAVALGDLEPWRAVALEARAVRRPRFRRPNLALLLIVGALVAGVVALVEPASDAHAETTWTFVLDRSPSMFLAHGGTTRIASAIAAARDLVAQSHGGTARVRWITTLGAETTQAVESQNPPENWLVPARAPEPEIDFEAYDTPQTVWITDRAPVRVPIAAGFVASGGSAVPGAIAVDGRDRIDWDGDGLVRVPNAGVARTVVLSGDVPRDGPLRRIVAAWSSARALTLGASDDPALTIEFAARNATDREVQAGRDGWSARGRSGASASAKRPALHSTWLAGFDSAVLVSAAPGDVWIGWSPLEEPSGDPAAFAVSWSALLDAVLLPPAGVVPLDERRDAEMAVIRAPIEPADGAPASHPEPFVWVALGLCLAAMLRSATMRA